MSQVSHLRSFNIKPIYVFDGAPPKEKQEILNQRKEQKEKMYCKLELLLEDIKTLDRVKLTDLITAILNANRSKISKIGVKKLNNSAENLTARNIIV
mgnify:CR=1 FL=1